MSWDPNIELIKSQGEVHFLREAYKFAWEHSDDLITKVGAVIVDLEFNEIIAYGTNHFPRGVNPTPEQIMNREWKYKHIIHAEPSAIYDAARKGISTEGKIMYIPWIPCLSCAGSIIDAGIDTLVSHKEMVMITPEHWRESTDYALSLLRDAGLNLFMYEGKIGNVKSFLVGEEWQP